MPFARRFSSAPASASLAGSYHVCLEIARSHYENFPVASRLLPRRMRPHIAAVYAFARSADDFADEDDRPAVERHRLLDDWLVRLRSCAGGGPRIDASQVGGPALAPDRRAAIFEALGHTIRTFELPVALFEDLLSAFRQDISTRRYATWTELLDYCRRSANPVGRIVLRIAGRSDAALDRASDALCTALQLTNFWQDLARDWRRGRLYVPAEDRGPGADEAILDRGELGPGWRLALGRAAGRTRALFYAGRPVCDGLEGRLRFELRLTWLGGLTILNRLERIGFDVFQSRPVLGASDVPRLCWRALRWT